MLVTVRLDKDLVERLQYLSEETHRSKSHYIKEALIQYLQDKEDYMLALAVFERDEPVTSIAEVRKGLGLDD